MEQLVPKDFIPSTAVWTERQQELLKRIARPESTADENLFIRRAMQAVDPRGECAGLAYKGPGGVTLLVMFLRSVISLSIADQPGLEPLRSAAMAAVDQIDARLRSTAAQAAWKFLGSPPRSAENRVLHFHSAVLHAPAYSLIAARLQRGIAAKVAQLADQSPETADRRLGGLLLAVIPIVKMIPATDANPGAEELPANFDAVVRTAILHMRRKRARRFANSRYAPASYRVFWNNWGEIFFARPLGKEFHHRHVPSRKASTPAGFRGRDDENFIGDPDHDELLAQWDMIEQQEEKEIGILSRKPKILRKCSQRGRLDPGSAAVLLTPSSTMPGSLPKVVLALLDAGLDELAGEWTELNAGVARGLVDCMLYLGRRAEWLLRMRLGRKPSSIRECVEPILDPLQWIIYHRPELYLGMPEYLLPPSKEDDTDWKGFERAWRDHDAVFEPVDLIYQVALPFPLRKEMRSLLAIRRKALRNSPIRKRLDAEQGAFWIWQEKSEIVPLSPDHVDLVLDRLTEFLRWHIPGYPRLRQAHLCRTFEGHFAEHGLRPELGHYVSGRLNPGVEMALRYSRISQIQITRAHALASDRFHKKIREERVALGLPKRIETRSQDHPLAFNDHGDCFVGSWRCARSDLIRPILAELQEAVKSPTSWDPNLPRKRAVHNTYVRLAAFSLALLNGLRPKELSRLRNQDVDIQSLWIAIRGKPHLHRAAYRRLPILPGMGRLLDAIMKETKGTRYPRRRLLGLFTAGSMWRSATVEDLENIPVDAGERQGLHTVFDLYGLRHRFRTDYLDAGVPYDLVNYLMGHESAGFEAFSIYKDSGPGPVKEIYEEVACKLARRYGWEE